MGMGVNVNPGANAISTTICFEVVTVHVARGEGEPPGGTRLGRSLALPSVLTPFQLLDITLHAIVPGRQLPEAAGILERGFDFTALIVQTGQ